MNLLPAIEAIKAQIREMEIKHHDEIKPYKESPEVLRKVNTACEKCDGTGRVFRRSCAEDDGDYYKCDACRGTGLIR